MVRLTSWEVYVVRQAGDARSLLEGLEVLVMRKGLERPALDGLQHDRLCEEMSKIVGEAC